MKRGFSAVQAEDAVLVDSSEMGIDEVVEKNSFRIQRKGDQINECKSCRNCRLLFRRKKSS